MDGLTHGRLYQRLSLHPRARLSAFFKLYIILFKPLQTSLIFEAFAPLFCKISLFLRILKKGSRFFLLCFEFQPRVSGISENYFNNFAVSDAKMSVFQRI